MQSVARSLARYPVPYCRTMDHLHAWRFLLPKSIRETVIAFQPSHKDHEGTMYETETLHSCTLCLFTSLQCSDVISDVIFSSPGCSCTSMYHNYAITILTSSLCPIKLTLLKNAASHFTTVRTHCHFEQRLHTKTLLYIIRYTSVSY